MECDKAFLTWDGQPLLDRQLDLLRQLQPQELLLSGRNGVNYDSAKARLVMDEVPHAGPMAALATLLRGIKTTHLLVLAVDMPLMTVAMLQSLIAGSDPRRGCVPRNGKNWEPLAAVYPKTILPLIRQHQLQGQHAMQQLIDRAVLNDMVIPLQLPEGGKSAFANLNTPHDLLNLAKESP